MTVDQLSDKARELLTTALSADGHSKGLIALSLTVGGGGWAIAGDRQERVYGDSLADVQRAIDDLHDNYLIVQTATGGYIVTPLGCQVAGWTSTQST